MNKICIIKQPAGLGDILFLSKIRKILTDSGYEVIHPVIKEYKWLGEYIKGNFPVIENMEYLDFYNSVGLYIDKKIIDNKEITVIPLSTADRLYAGSVMDAKYKFLNINFNDWFNFLEIKRNINKENELFYEVLKLKEGDDYVLINNNYGSPPNFLKKNIQVGHTKKIYMDFYENFTLFDWIGVMEKASEIHVVESSINYVLEKLNITPEKIFIYSKHNPPSFTHVKHLFSKNWNYIY